MEPKHVTATDGKSGTPTTLAVTGLKVSPRGKTLSSSDSFCNTSPDSTLNDPFGKANYESDDSTANANNVPKLGKDNKSQFSDNKNPVSGSSIVCSGPLNHEMSPSMSRSEGTHCFSRSCSDNSSTTESPPMQVMEHSANESYRIPSSVFARDESANPADFWQSDELGELGTPKNFPASPAMCDFSPYQSSHEMELAEVKISRGNEDLKHERSLAVGRVSPKPMESGTNTMSFAFPVLSGNLDKNYSQRMAAPTESSLEQKQPQLESAELHTESPPQSEPKTPTTTEGAGKTQWFPFFSCCSSGS